jgi:oligopeptidase B
LLAYTVDFVGGETCQLFVKNLETGEIVSHDPDLELYGVVLWGPNDETLYYSTMDDAHRPYRVYKHVLGTKHSQDELIFEEEDELFWMYASKTLDKRYLLISTQSKETAEVHYLDLFSDDTTLQCVAKRRKKVLYSVKHHEGSWFISTNVGGTPNMKLVSCPVGPNCEDQWMDVVDETTGKTLFDGGYDRALSGITCFKQYAVACGREGGIPRVWVMKYENNGSSSKVCNFDQLTFDETAYDVGLGSHYEYDTSDLVIGYDSLITPLSTLKIDMSHDSMNEGERVVLKSKAVPGYNKDEYGCDRITVKSRDGITDIPISLVYRKDVMEQHLHEGVPIPTHLYGYGSYGACMEASFRATRLPLLDRGMVYIIAHVRGGGEMGRQWYEEPMGAKYLCKKNTFNDFVDVARWLVDEKKMTTSALLSCEGRSAGGLLIGASINQAPDLFKVAILGVPFVDVVPTMIDASIPLTIVEWEEWGTIIYFWINSIFLLQVCLHSLAPTLSLFIPQAIPTKKNTTNT